MALGTVIGDMTRFVGEVVRVEINRAADLAAGLRSAGRRVFRAVAMVAHSNERGVRLAADAFTDWEELAKRLRPVKPEKLLLIACRAGLPHAAEALFRGVPTLRRVYACPDLLAFSQAVPVSVLAPLFLGEADVPPNTRLLLQGLQLWRNQGLFFEFRREDFRTEAARANAVLETLCALGLKHLARR